MSDLNALAATLISSAGVKSFVGDEITVSHKGHAATGITAEFCRDVQSIDEVTGMFVEAKRATFKLDAADLVINGSAVVPVPGMRITIGSETWEVQPPNSNQQCYAPLMGGLRWLIYAVQVG